MQEGQYLYSVATGSVAPWIPGSMEAMQFITSLPGFVALHPEVPYGTLWLFDSKAHAEAARIALIEKEAIVGNNIALFVWNGSDVISFVGPA